MDDDERILAEKLTNGDENAWEAFCRRYSGPLLNAVRLRFGCAEELAEEVVHVTFIRCVRSIKTFDPARGRLFDWLRAIARNEANRLLPKRLPPGQVPFEPDDGRWIERMDQAELPDAQLCRKEVRSAILETVMALSSHYRQVLVMKYIEGRRVADMAAILGQSEKAVESLLTRSRVAFKEEILRRCREREGDWS